MEVTDAPYSRVLRIWTIVMVNGGTSDIGDFNIRIWGHLAVLVVIEVFFVD
jgi:hypothetical protein